ncbi:MAG: hypothetical protein KAJ19_10040, partial [Gammaproteobacteria bacterium]|nr:hypothetical protein [Gammaproteobacteria bacterium]
MDALVSTPLELLNKAVKMKSVKTNLGTWQGLKIIAIGPKNGKIVGYRANGDPIYAGSKTAKAMVKHKKAKSKYTPDQTDKAIAEWLLHLGIKGKNQPYTVNVTASDAEKLSEAFGVATNVLDNGIAVISKAELKEHLGKPLVPKKAELAAWSAKMAAGDHDDSVFPDLDTLTELPAGKFAGSHDNRLFKDTNGKKWVFKASD